MYLYLLMFWIGVLIFFIVIGIVFWIQDEQDFAKTTMGKVFDHMKKDQDGLIDFIADGYAHCEHDGEQGHECNEVISEDERFITYTCKYCGKSIQIINFKKVQKILDEH